MTRASSKGARASRNPKEASPQRSAVSRAKGGAVGEFELLAKVRTAVARLGLGDGVVVGIGDDCAVVRGPAASRGASKREPPLQILTTDTMVEGVHFRAGWLTPRELGVRAFRAAVSDVSAMGGRARYVLLSLELAVGPGGFDAKEALALVRGVAADARRAGATLVGGNVSGAAQTGVTVTVVGETRGKPVLRSGARAGDLVLVTGSLGGAAAGVLALRPPASHDKALSAAWRRPPLRVDFAAELGERGLAHAMVDVSDGLLQDLAHVADASRVALRIDASAVPVHRAARRLVALDTRGASRRPAAALALALGGGEDYELAFTAAPAARPAIERLAHAHRVPLAVVGSVIRGRPGVTDTDGRPFAIAATGFDHLRRRGSGATKAR